MPEDTDPRLADLRAAQRLRVISALTLVIAAAMFGPLFLARWAYPEPLGSYIRYSGLAALVGLLIYRWSIMRRPLGPAASKAAER